MRIGSFSSLLFLAPLAGCVSRSPRDKAVPDTEVAPAAAAPSGDTPHVDGGAPFVPEQVKLQGKAMGTHLAFAAFTSPNVGPVEIQRAWDEAVREIQRIEAVMTTWRDDSVVSKVNQAAGKAPVVVDPETLLMVEEALKMNRLSEGTFDITFETLHGLWKFDEDLDPHPADPKKIKALLPFVGSKHIIVDKAGSTVFLDHEKTKIGLGGIAKGYAVDRAVAVFDKYHVGSFYFQAGGDLFARGRKPDGTEWNAGIRDPRGNAWPNPDYFAMLSISDRAFSTAGDYERSYVVGGVRYHHIIDPRTGMPGKLCRSVTIWAKSALLADELDDAVFLLGPEKGLKLVESFEDAGAVILDAKNNLWISERLKGKLVLRGVPKDGI